MTKLRLIKVLYLADILSFVEVWRLYSLASHNEDCTLNVQSSEPSEPTYSLNQCSSSDLEFHKISKIITVKNFITYILIILS